MAGTLYFVHGTGVRAEGFERSLRLIREGVSRNHLAVDNVRGTPWGDELGVKVDHLAEVLPPGVSARAVEAEPLETEIVAAMWANLIDDPLFELRIAAARGVQQTAVAGLPGLTFPSQAVEAALKGLQVTSAELEGTDISEIEIRTAADRLAAWSGLSDAAGSFADPADPDLGAAVARAIVASVIAQHRTDPPGTAPAIVYDAARRDALVATIAAKLAPASARGFGGWLKEKAEELAKARATSFVRDRRTGWTSNSLPGIGDILFYQRRGGDIIGRIAADLASCRKPILAVGHSLGGIMLVDLLSRGDALGVDLVVTVGSQSPLLYIIGSLELLRPSSGRAPFTPWLNIYNPNDFLSFCAERAFAGQRGIYDKVVRSDVPFPDSHSAYWLQDDTYRHITALWPVSRG